MGSVIEKVAFMPPDPAFTRSTLGAGKGKAVQYVTNKRGNKVSFIHFQHKGADDSSGVEGGNGKGGYRGAANSKQRTPYTMLFCHGNAEDLGRSYQGFSQMHRESGVDIVAFDYSGYGLSEGKSSEKAAYADADAVFQHMQQEMGIPRNRIVIVGRSLGSGIATELAANVRGAAGLVLLSPLASAVQVLGKAAAFALYFNDIFVNIRKIEKVVDYPVLIVHGKLDDVVPFSHGQELFDLVSKVNPRTSHLWLETCGHNDIESLEPHQFYATLRKFLAELSDDTPRPPALAPSSKVESSSSGA